MSFRLMAKALDIRTGSPLTKLVLIKLSDYADENTGECFPSLQTIADQCEMSKRSVSNHIHKLIELGIVKKLPRMHQGKQTSNLYKISIVDGLQEVQRRVAVGATGGSRKCNGGLHEVLPDPINEPINEPIKDLTSEKKFSDDDLKCAKWILERVLKITPRAQPNIEKWADVIRLMRTRNKLTHRQISEVFDFANRDSFWQTNILSPTKLREKFDQLEAKMNQEGAQHGKSNSESRLNVEQFEDQSRYPEEIRLCTSDSKAVREFKLAYQQDFRESPSDYVLESSDGDLSEQMDRDQWIEGECSVVGSDIEDWGEGLPEIN